MDDFAEKLKQANTTITITPESLTMEKPGEKFRGLYVGTRPFDKQDPKTGEIKRMTVAHFWTGEKLVFNMGRQLTDSIQILPPGTSVEITLRELKKNSGGGSTKIYDITPLDIPRVDLRSMFGGFLEITAPRPEDLLPAPRDLRVVWQNFCKTNSVQEIHIRQALGTLKVSEWLAAESEKPRTIEDAMALVLDAMKPEAEPHF